MRLRLLAGGVSLGLAVGLASASPAAATSYICSGKQTTLFDNTNSFAVSKGGSPPTFSTKGKAYCLTYVQTYHWNNGSGSSPGKVGVTRQGTAPAGSGISNGIRLPAKASAGQGGAPNVNWYADRSYTQPLVLDGTYTCYDSEPSTWSANKESSGAGFCIVYVDPAVVSAASTTTTSGAAGPPASSSGGGSDLTWLWILLASVGILLGLMLVAYWQWQDGMNRWWDAIQEALDAIPEEEEAFWRRLLRRLREMAGQRPEDEFDPRSVAYPPPGPPPPAILTADATFDPPESPPVVDVPGDSEGPTTEIPGDSSPPDDNEVM